jgi:hypothetical protein
MPSTDTQKFRNSKIFFCYQTFKKNNIFKTWHNMHVNFNERKYTLVGFILKAWLYPVYKVFLY